MNVAEFVKRIKTYPFASIMVLLTIVLFALSYIRSMENSKLSIRHDDAVRTWNRIDSNVFKNSIGLEEHLEEATAISENLKSRLIRPSELAQNYQYFFRLESVADIKILSLQQETLRAPDPKKTDKKKEKPLFSRVPYTMGTSGEFHDLLAFLYALENGEHFYHLKECTIQLDPRSGGRTISMVMKFDLLGTP